VCRCVSARVSNNIDTWKEKRKNKQVFPSIVSTCDDVTCVR
jgi:hypothetical protein